MTVIQLRKLARENKVKLSAGIDKEGIVQRLYDALGDQPEPPVQAPEETAPAAEESLPAAETSVSSPVPSNPILEVRPEESLAADVTSVQPGIVPGARSVPRITTIISTPSSARAGRRVLRLSGKRLPVPPGSSSVR